MLYPHPLTSAGLSSDADKTIASEQSRSVNELINPFVFDLKITQWACLPSYLVLIFSSVLVLYIVLKKYRSVLNVHFSVLFYIFCQIQFLVVTTVSWISESSKNDTSLTENQLKERFKVQMPFQTFSMILPGYAVLMMTLVRTIFVSRPLSYFDYIRRRYQVFGAGLSAALCALISSLPSMGALCDIQVNTVLSSIGSGYFRYCAYHGESCSFYFVVLVGLGSVLPVVLISSLYIYIYKLTVAARKAHEALTKSSSSQQNEGGSSRCAEVKRGERETDRSSKERRSVPWSIVAILAIFVASSTPWIVLEVLNAEIIDLVMMQQAGARIFDLFYALPYSSPRAALLLTTCSLTPHHVQPYSLPRAALLLTTCSLTPHHVQPYFSPRAALLLTTCSLTLHHVQSYSSPRAALLLTTCSLTLHHVQPYSSPRVVLLLTTCSLTPHHVQPYSSPRAALLLTTCSLTPHHVQSYSSPRAALLLTTCSLTPHHVQPYSSPRAALLPTTCSLTPHLVQLYFSPRAALLLTTCSLTSHHVQPYSLPRAALLLTSCSFTPHHVQPYSSPRAVLLLTTCSLTPHHVQPYSSPRAALLLTTCSLTPYHVQPYSSPRAALLLTTCSLTPHHVQSYSSPRAVLLLTTCSLTPYHVQPYSSPRAALLLTTCSLTPAHYLYHTEYDRAHRANDRHYPQYHSGKCARLLTLFRHLAPRQLAGSGSYLLLASENLEISTVGTSHFISRVTLHRYWVSWEEEGKVTFVLECSVGS
ncbi:hypothetical protein ACHWQZ_G005940 [Mnemiopsis leidyi]